MGVWLPITLVAMTQIALRLITVVAVVWRERARAESHRVQMETAAASGVTLCERLGDDTQQPHDRLAADEGVEGGRAVEDDVGREHIRGGVDVQALDGRAEPRARVLHDRIAHEPEHPTFAPCVRPRGPPPQG